MGTHSQSSATVDVTTMVSLASPHMHGVKIRLQGLPKSVFHATLNDRGQVRSILNGIDPKYLSPISRFGRAFYVSEEFDTSIAEMRHHGVDPTHVIRFVMTIKVARILDLTKPHLAAKYAYLGGPVSSATQAIGEAALRDGYKVIRYYSERVAGKINNAIMDDYNEVLNVQIVTQVRR